MFALKLLDCPVGGTGSDDPMLGMRVEPATRDLAAEKYLATQGTHLVCASFPHHSRSLLRIAEGVDQGLDHILALLGFSLWQQCVLDCGCKRKSLDALRRPIGGNLFAAHAPHFFGIGLEEDPEKPFAKLVDHPILERLGIGSRTKARHRKRRQASN